MLRGAAILLAFMIGLFTAAIRPAVADVYYVTYTGTASGRDTNGVFGTAGATLSNAAFTSTYTYDPSAGHSVSSQPTYIELFGGSAYCCGSVDPLLSASITINGQTHVQGSLYQGVEEIYGGTGTPSFSSIAYEAPVNPYGESLSNSGNVSGHTILSLTAVQSFAITSGTASFNDGYESLSLTDSYVSVTDGPPPSAIPEPASLGLLGCAAVMFAAAAEARRRR